MKKLLILAGAATMVASAQANLISNGGFEATAIAANSWVGVNASNIATYVPGWGFIGPENHNIALTGAGYLGQSTQEVDVSGGSDTVPSGLFQTISTTINQAYQVSFQIYTGGGIGYSGGVNFDLYDGALYGTGIASGSNLQGNPVSGNAGLKTYTYNFVATSTQATVAFTMFSQPVSHVDNVQVNAVPEPFTMSLGIASAGLFLRRRLKTKRG